MLPIVPAPKQVNGFVSTRFQAHTEAGSAMDPSSRKGQINPGMLPTKDDGQQFPMVIPVLCT